MMQHIKNISLISFILICNYAFLSNSEKISTTPSTLNLTKKHDQNTSTVFVGKKPNNSSNTQRTSEVTLRFTTPCVTPNGDEAYCMPLKSCTKLYNQIDSKEAKDFLKKSRCGPKNESKKDPKVCCGKYDNYIELVNSSLFPKSCGYQNVSVSGRIMGGTEAALDEFPWIARLFHKKAKSQKIFGCAGFLITEKFILTAAHCLDSENIKILGPIKEVQLGEHNTETKIDCSPDNKTCASKPQVIKIKKIIIHPSYDKDSPQHHDDIGLILLKKSAKFTKHVYPICLPDKLENDPSEYWISGWGTTGPDELYSPIKMKVSLPPFSHLNCSEKYKTIYINVSKDQICAGGMKNKDSCSGDSGGPLMFVEEKNHWFAAGVVSYGLGCGLQGWPGIYTNIVSYRSWIESTILKNSSKKSKNAKKKKLKL